MKSLIIADVHANLAALQAVLNAEKDWDEVIFLGDAVIGGPQPEESVALLSTLSGTFIMGNHDREALERVIDPGDERPEHLWIRWTQQQLSSRSRESMETFLPPQVIARDGLTLHLRHGDEPERWGGRIWPDTSPSILAEMAQEFREPWVLLAHSHIQFTVQHGHTVFVNPGSVGAPRLHQPLACYARLEDGRLEQAAVPYDAEATAAAMDLVPIDESVKEAWKRSYLGGYLPDRYPIRDWQPLIEAGYR